MSAFRGTADILDPLLNVPLMTQSGHWVQYPPKRTSPAIRSRIYEFTAKKLKRGSVLPVVSRK